MLSPASPPATGHRRNGRGLDAADLIRDALKDPDDALAKRLDGDERHDLRWYWRILIQVVAALILIYGGGVRIEQIGPVFGAGAASLG
ncbi:MAG TPA: hypothetical protein PKB03_00840, partial [Baekduia sp.]|nr:hypothetical protein [Baekduia sp.]